MGLSVCFSMTVAEDSHSWDREQLRTQYVSLYISTYLSICYLSVYLSVCLSMYPLIHSSLFYKSLTLLVQISQMH